MGYNHETIELITQLSEERNIYKRFTDEVCDLFAIPESERQKPYVASQIIERIKQFQTSYIMRRSVVEKENGSAFTVPEIPNVIDRK